MPTIIYIMGVSGAGKTTVGVALAAATDIPFFDGDDFHPAANVEKMRSGKPLNDDDRTGWLNAIHSFVRERIKNGQSAIVACSALKKKYRTRLEAGIDSEVRWVWLAGSYDLIRRRMEKREGHFMPAALLRSQFEDLEPPEKALKVDINQPLSKIITYLKSVLS